MILAVCIADVIALCVLLCWVEHRVRLGDAVERAVIAERARCAEDAERAVLIERHRTAVYMRKQSRMAESISKCRYLTPRTRDQEAYASVVLWETASELEECEHHKVAK